MPGREVIHHTWCYGNVQNVLSIDRPKELPSDLAVSSTPLSKECRDLVYSLYQVILDHLTLFFDPRMYQILNQLALKLLCIQKRFCPPGL
jgi:hypothetical protein